MESLGQVTGGVAHDFNNLLAVFANGLQVLERNITAEVRQRVREGMRRAVARGTALTHHLLSFSRRRPINPEPIHLAAHLRGMREMLDRSLGGHIHVEMKFATELWPVEVDLAWSLAMLNLCERTGRDGGRRHHHHYGRELAKSAENGLVTDLVKPPSPTRARNATGGSGPRA